MYIHVHNYTQPTAVVPPSVQPTWNWRKSSPLRTSIYDGGPGNFITCSRAPVIYNTRSDGVGVPRVPQPPVGLRHQSPALRSEVGPSEWVRKCTGRRSPPTHTQTETDRGRRQGLVTVVPVRGDIGLVGDRLEFSQSYADSATLLERSSFFVKYDEGQAVAFRYSIISRSVRSW